MISKNFLPGGKMTFLEIYNATKELAPSLRHELPTAEEYLFLDREKFTKFILRLKKITRTQQEILVVCIDAASGLIQIKKHVEEKPDYREIYHAVVNRRIHKVDEQAELTSLLATIFSIRGVIETKKRSATVKFHNKEYNEENYNQQKNMHLIEAGKAMRDEQGNLIYFNTFGDE